MNISLIAEETITTSIAPFTNNSLNNPLDGNPFNLKTRAAVGNGVTGVPLQSEWLARDHSELGNTIEQLPSIANTEVTQTIAHTPELATTPDLATATQSATQDELTGVEIGQMLVGSSSSSSDQIGNDFSTAFNLGTLNQFWLYQESVGDTDPSDFYAFSLSQPSNFGLSLDGLSADADVRLFDSSGSLISGSYASSTTAETINLNLQAGLYYVQVYPYSGNTDYLLFLAATAESSTDWFSQNLSDAETIALGRSLATDGQFSRSDMINLLSGTGDGGGVDANELTDLRTIVNYSSLFNMPDYVEVLSNKVINSDVANITSGIGNLYAGSSTAQLDSLIGKWFYGTDRPDLNTDADAIYTYQYAEGVLFQDGIQYSDINQGRVGDCYFVAALAGTALQAPTAIEEMFIDNGDGTFTVRFFNEGVADYVTVDRYLPTDANGNLVYAGLGDFYADPGNELWVALAEKAYAQINESGWIEQDHTNSYEGIAEGYPGLAIEHITGVDAASYSMNPDSILSTFQSGEIVLLATPDYPSNSVIVGNHAYVLLGYDASTAQFLLFNPWGIGNQRDGGIIALTSDQLLANFSAWDATIG